MILAILQTYYQTHMVRSWTYQQSMAPDSPYTLAIASDPATLVAPLHVNSSCRPKGVYQVNLLPEGTTMYGLPNDPKNK